MGLHRGDDVGVVDLLATDRDRGQEAQEVGRDRGPVLGDPELGLEADDVRDEGGGSDAWAWYVQDQDDWKRDIDKARSGS